MSSPKSNADILKDAQEKINFERRELELRVKKGYPKSIQELLPDDLRPRAYNELAPHLIAVRQASARTNTQLAMLEEQKQAIVKRAEELIKAEEDLTDLMNVYLPPYGHIK